MTNMSDVELLLILGFYYIGKEKNIERFTSLYNSYFGKDLSTQTILHEVSKFRNINPANNIGGAVSDPKLMLIWDEYIEKDKVSELKELYKSFINKEFQWKDSFQLHDREFGPKGAHNIVDKPKELETMTTHERTAYKRDRSVVENSLYDAGYICEGECENDLFLRTDGKTTYTEGHHLIPLCFQPSFKYSLDVEANVVSLCPRCHRLLHYGLEKEALLRILYTKRVTRLKNCGISISYEKLLLLYAGTCIDARDE
jgi:5-methylcytosine-specific restriction protein A